MEENQGGLDNGRYCYVLVDSIEDGMFKREKVIRVGGDNREILVDLASLAKTKAGFQAVRFYEFSRNHGKAMGYVENCETGFTSDKRREVPVDSLAEESQVEKLISL